MKAASLLIALVTGPGWAAGCWLARSWRAACLFAALALGGAVAHAEATPLVIDPSATQVDLSKLAYLLEDPQGTLTIDDVRKPENASRFVAGNTNPGFTPSAYWMRFVVTNPTDKTVGLWFDTGNRTLQEIDLYVVEGQGGVSRQSTGSTKRFSERPLPTSTFVFPVSLPAGQPTEFFLRVRSTGYLGVTVIPKLWQAEAYEAKDRQDEVVWSVMLGVAVALLVVNGMLYGYLKDISYLLYTLALASNVWSGASSFGGFGPTYEFLWPDSPMLEQSVWSLPILPAAMFPVLFVMHLLHFREIYPHLTRVILISMVLLGISIGVQMAGTILQISDTARVLQIFFIIGGIVWIPIFPAAIWGLLIELRKGNRNAYFIAVGFAPVIVSTFVLAYQGNLGIPMSWYLALAAAAWEWLVMALLLADRFGQEVKAKLGAQAEVVQTLQRSEQVLEAKVVLRTQELSAEQQRTQQLLKAVSAEKARTQEMLHNILPADIADELSSTGTTQPVRHEEASVLFTDFSGFTQAASTMPAGRMVAELNEVFAAFDDICDEEGVEKIKTIGDAYMAAAGLPKPCDDHAQRCVRAGLRMVAFVDKRNADSSFKWRLRVGIHSGPVVAGVVGKRKYAFDIWGDTVNIAARMESAGEPGRVNVSAYTRDLVRRDFECEYRGKVDAKGKGEVDMYFVAPNLRPCA